MFLQAALNGVRSPAVHPAIPVTVEDLARDARAAIEAGAKCLHVHVRDTQSHESLAPADVTPVLRALRLACPSVPIGLSTGAWIVPELAERHRQIHAWEVLPDYVSINFDEPAADVLAAHLLGRGVGVEVGLNGGLAAERFVQSGLVSQCLRVLLEPGDATLEDALRTVAVIEGVLDTGGAEQPRLLHGTDTTAWPLLREAAQRGYPTRVGFEDVLTLPNGSPAGSNSDLIRAAIALLR